MDTGDYIQTAILLVLTATLFAWVWQIVIQNRLLKAQILRDRLEMYWQTYEPVSDDEVQELHLIPEDYMDKLKYEVHYKKNPEAIRRYITMLALYEYLAFTYSLIKLKLPDPLGYDWTKRWAKDLLEYIEFLYVHEYHNEYYPEFAAYVDGVLKNKKNRSE